MAQIDILSICCCSAAFKASGDAYAVGLRYNSWLEKHSKCPEEKKETIGIIQEHQHRP